MSAVEVVRGGVVESRHLVNVAVCDESGEVVACAGDPRGMTYYRSAAKPFQALPLVEEGVVERLGLSAAELALCCASHEGEPEHVAAARSILAKAGVGEDLLACGPHPPFSVTAARAMAHAGEEPRRIHNNCSGKHAGMLALAVVMGWDPAGYHRADHPVQRRMRSEIRRWSGVPDDAIASGVDGCGVVCFAVPLHRMAASFARFGASPESGPRAVVSAMTAHPFMVGGSGRACTDVMRVSEGRAFVKLGAEGVYGGGLPARGLGFAIKVADGGRRAVEVALVRTLEELGVLGASDLAALAAHARPELRNTRDEVVGEVRPAFSLGDLPAMAR